MEQAGSVILNKVNEVNLAIASTVSDRVIDEVVESLSKTCKNLVSYFCMALCVSILHVYYNGCMCHYTTSSTVVALLESFGHTI